MLSSSDLESCASILEEHESTSLDTEQIIHSTRRLMTKIVLDVNQCFFSGNDVETKLTTLEMLKEQFAAHEGKNWLVNGFEFGCPAALPMVFNVNPQELQLSVP